MPQRPSTIGRFRILAGRLLWALALMLGPAAAQQIAPADLAAMALPELTKLVDSVITQGAREALAMRDAGGRGDCVELVGISNAFGLAYRYLGEVRDVLRTRPGAPSALMVARIGQARVHAFAGRVRTEQWLEGCGTVMIPDEKQADPRYAAPVTVTLPEFTQAIIEAREAGTINLQFAAQILKSNKCGELNAAVQSITLFVPYVDKLLSDIASRPAALGPRASRNGLAQVRRHLLDARTTLKGRIETVCKAGATETPPAEGATPQRQ